MQNYCVYRHICPNGKVYIGITGDKPENRWANGAKYHHNKHFISAIKFFGWDNIKHEILFDSLTKEEAEAKEIELIAEHKSNQREFGYNQAAGGNSCSGWRWPEESKKRLSEICKGIPHKGHKLSEETKEKLRQAAKKRGVSVETVERLKSANIGRPLAEEHKHKISAALKGRVVAEETRKKLSIVNMGKKLSAETRQRISEAQKGKERNPHKQSTKDKIGERLSKRVAQYSLNGEYISTYKSASEASRVLHISQGNISAVCRGERNNAAGFLWRYVNNEKI